MPVYVDDMRLPATVEQYAGRWSHLTATTEPELHEFAFRIGLRPDWFQPQKFYPATTPSGRPHKWAGQRKGTFHYDVTDPRRDMALALGAIPLVYGSNEAWLDVFSPGWRGRRTVIQKAG